MKSNETHSRDTAVLLLSSDVHERIRLGIFICKKVALLIEDKMASLWKESSCQSLRDSQ